MKGLTRKIDDLGRIVIPAEMRHAQHIKNGDPFRIVYTPRGVLLEPLNASCGFCGSTDGLIVVEGVAICSVHAKAIHEAWEARNAGGKNHECD